MAVPIPCPTYSEDAQLDTVALDGGVHHGLHRVTHRVEAGGAPLGLAGGGAGHGGHGRPERPVGGGVEDPVRLVPVAAAHHGGEGGVAVPLGAVVVGDVGAAVEGDEVAVDQHPLAGDRVDHLVVDRDAHAGT